MVVADHLECQRACEEDDECLVAVMRHNHPSLDQKLVISAVNQEGVIHRQQTFIHSGSNEMKSVDW
eukprot:UN28185